VVTSTFGGGGRQTKGTERVETQQSGHYVAAECAVIKTCAESLAWKLSPV
jgi:hypothetical protein